MDHQVRVHIRLQKAKTWRLSAATIQIDTEEMSPESIAEAELTCMSGSMRFEKVKELLLK